MLPGNWTDLFVIRNNVKCLRDSKLVVPPKNTTNFGLKSATFIGAKVWNSLPDELPSSLKEFVNTLRELDLWSTVFYDSL